MEYLTTTFYLKELHSVRWQICVWMIDWNGCERKWRSPLFRYYISIHQAWLLKTKKTLSGNSRYSKSESHRYNIWWMSSAIYLPHNHIPARYFVISLRVYAYIYWLCASLFGNRMYDVCVAKSITFLGNFRGGRWSLTQVSFPEKIH